ncbi:hypothetical protein F8388_011544 [Cannabis sativa]|uniref:non-specific serine/threonine protein kinase n=1 Tax=Cannabis sativa TaxID=3483 RepID=A0A7J6EXR9_CANSA|nr:hypothetical protein G4B88_029673 [Cannabis sativa]KAF4387396.1 hypothetical protein F8388_011544 [Cannabis sativa]
MYSSKSLVFSTALVLYFCWSSLYVEAQFNITDPVEVNALRAIRRSLDDPNKNLTNWNRGDPCSSSWNGVLCFNTTFDDGYLHVRELQLLNMNLSGTLSPELGRLSHMRILLLNGNQLTGILPEELGYLPNLDRIQIDQNHISGPIPKSFANLNKTKHFHMNNNSISGQIPPELSRLPNLVHFLLDNNELSGELPAEFSELPELLILQLDNNNFDGSTIPESFGNMSKLLKLSLRNCSLQGPIPNLSRIPKLGYLDLSSNQLNGTIPPDKLSNDITTIDLSNNNLIGTIPNIFSGLPNLQKLSVANNTLNGTVPSTIWRDRSLNSTERLVLEFQNNGLTDISGSISLPPNVTVWFEGNPLCTNSSLVHLCGPERADNSTLTEVTPDCPVQSCPFPYEYSNKSPDKCFCAAPLLVEYRLKSPGFSDFLAYKVRFEEYLSDGLKIQQYQLEISEVTWVKGPRLRMSLKLFPVYIVNDTKSNTFNTSEVQRLMALFTGWTIPDSEIFGPYELLRFNLLGPYVNAIPFASNKSGISRGAIIGIVIGGIAAATALSTFVSLVILRKRMRNHAVSKKRRMSKASLKIEGVKDFTYGEMMLATNNFESSAQIGQGGYGKVYKGILEDGTLVAIKRAQEGSLQGEKEFLTEIELLSRLHHRNLVSLLGFCDEQDEQMLIYEFMANGTLRDHLSVKSKEPLSFSMRLRIALGSAKGILYLHTEANPPIFHRDIKASNILLDSKLIAKVADFGLSRLAPVPEIEGDLPEHVSTVVKGTPGYLDPEYFLTRKLTDKSDVYSFGVVLLELLTGMQPISHGKNIVREVNLAFQSGMIFSVIDGRMGSYPSDCVEKFLDLALKCCQESTDSRPSMAEVVRQLENIWLMMPESDTKSLEPVITPKAGKQVTSPSSSSEIRNPYMSFDVSGSNLDSGVIPTIAPR